MNLEKKQFDGEFKSYYDKIKSHGDGAITDIYDYSPVSGNIQNLYWEGESKNSIINSVQTIDQSCLSLYLLVSNIIKKAKIIYTILYPELETLKNKIDLYNETIDAIISTMSQIDQAKANGDSNG